MNVAPINPVWTGFFNNFYCGALVFRNVIVAVDGDRCYLPMPRNLEDLRVAPGYAYLTALLSALSLGCDGSEFGTYARRAGLQLGDLQWPHERQCPPDPTSSTGEESWKSAISAAARSRQNSRSFCTTFTFTTNACSSSGTSPACSSAARTLRACSLFLWQQDMIAG
jgi:hypothetical protein